MLLLLLLVCTIARSPKCIFDGVKKKDIVADKPELIITLCPVVDHHYPYLLHEKSGFITRQMKLKKIAVTPSKVSISYFVGDFSAIRSNHMPKIDELNKDLDSVRLKNAEFSRDFG